MTCKTLTLTRVEIDASSNIGTLNAFMPDMPLEIGEELIKRSRVGDVPVRQYEHNGAILGYAFIVGPVCHVRLLNGPGWSGIIGPRDLECDARNWMAQTLAR